MKKSQNEIFITEVLPNDDPRMNCPEADEACEQELAGLLSRNTWEVIDLVDVEMNSSIPTGRSVVRLKIWGLTVQNSRPASSHKAILTLKKQVSTHASNHQTVLA